MGAIEVKYFNSFILRKTVDSGDLPVWNGSRGNNTYPKEEDCKKEIEKFKTEYIVLKTGL